MKISESTEFKIDLKTVIGIIMLTTTLVGMYYTLEKDIQLAKTLPPNEVTRLEYELKEEWNEEMIMQLKSEVETIGETIDILKEEVKITSSMIKDGSEAGINALESLNKQLEELQNKKSTTRVIVKEVKVDKKGRKL
tara:strand:+ start:231 stop:641 length:411 start_codon:yes stop_codon:yes gene_type:complete